MSQACKFCNNPITFRKENEKFVPMNPDGTRHDCRSRSLDKPAPNPTPPLAKPDLLTQFLNSKDFEARVRQIAEALFKELVGV